MREEKIKEIAESLTSFFLVFDGLFLHDEEAETLLQEALSSLKEKVLHNESCLPVILAMGGTYDSNVDRAKIKEIEALVSLVEARKKLQKETEKERSRKKQNINALSFMFGI